jgi:hypothetical protein
MNSMAVLTIMIVLVVLWASRNGRLKVVLTPEEAKVIRERWRRTAWIELKAWVLCFALGYALAADTLAREHWHWSIYALIVWCSLLFFSRLAIWITLAGVAVLVPRPGTTISKPQPSPEPPDPSVKHHTPEYDWDTDTWRYENGNHEPANIKYPKYEDRPENRNRL